MSTFSKVDVKRFIDGLHRYLSECLAPVNSRFGALEARITLLEAREANSIADAYKGAWMVGQYTRGSLVTRNGHLWLALADGDSKPGDGPSWKMIVRGGIGS